MGGDAAYGQGPGGEAAIPSHLLSDVETQQIPREEWLRAALMDQDPANYAGEGFGAVDEYFPQDIDDPFMRGKVTGQGDYYPGPDFRRRSWPPFR